MSPRCIAGLLALLVVVPPSPVRAEPPNALEAAERAYQDVDFERQRAEATRALEAGGNDPERLSQIYRLLGIAHAALNAPGEAKLAFTKLLAIDPDVQLEHVLSPRLRTPYMEARGFWAVTMARLSLDATGGVPDAAGVPRELSITLSDPLRMGASVRVIALGSPALTIAELTPRPRLRVARAALEAHAGKTLRVQLLDAHENVLVSQQFSPMAPLAKPTATSNAPLPRSGDAAGGARVAGLGAAKQNAAATRDGAEAFPVAAVFAGGGVLALGIGVTAHVIRERGASEWNGSACEQTGRGTRGEQCGGVDEQRRTAQNVAIVSYAAGGAMLAASLVHYLVTRGGQPPRNEGPVACGAGPAALGVSCSAVW